MKEYIFQINNNPAGNDIVVTDAPTGLVPKNILAIINKTTGKPVHSPIAEVVAGVTYSGTTMTITLNSDAPSIEGDLLIKAYSDVDIATEATATDAKTAAQAAQTAAEAITIPTNYAKEGTTIKNLDSLKSEVVTALQGSNASAATLLAIKNLLEDSTNGLAMLAKESAATANRNTVLSAINNTLQVNMLASGVSAMAGVLIHVINDDGVTTAYTLNANELYYFNARESDLVLTLNLNTVASGDIADFHLIVQVAAGPLTVTIKDSNNNDVVWSYDLYPLFSSGMTYEIGIINNLALFVNYVV